ncbi:SDR family oxidoreductase [Lignipirellula cremea]|uniref:Enoyl-[acyl-carrier-protein] reductase [NADPH] FabL n=1 Tax=Lignipirellula cremea TaxID=2528010 RepID=A0A518DPS5_9BACT|nr:SDR family oxidoreductase [Lignipirellula cremea]QDU93835.1 Enoyl-[acyl-carrier-protein] reductase [NADPH] FabL [Lignipirellula cremea]
MSQQTFTRVVECLAATTRYPHEFFTPDADMEEQLGIDSVKRVEILISLGQEFNLGLQSESYDPSIRTVGDVAAWIESLLPAEQPAVREQASQPVKVEREVPSRVAAVERISPPHGIPAPHVSPGRSVSPGLYREAQPAQVGQPLAGRTALVTGSGRGAGRVIARVLADRGAHVIINSFHSRDLGEKTAAEINALGGSAEHVWGSVANPDHVNRMFDEIGAGPGLDILICNASDGRVGSFLEITAKDWDRAFRTNVSGHHHCAVRAAEIMKPRGGGAMVTMSAVGAHQFIAGLGSQGVVKAAVESLTRYLACELGPSGIRVNCVAGGPVYGELLEQFPDSRAAQNHWESRTPDGELCTPLDLAETIAFLVSDQARGINGAVWMVDHGFSATADGQLQRRAVPARV